ncbi:MAG: PemK domain-containing protein [Microbacterium sp.]|nr:MAG: PemK domain-containing protein [Microbacterium sp.]
MRRARRRAGRRPSAAHSGPTVGALATVEVARPPAGLRLEYAPRRNGEPDAGEIVWAWVPYEEDPSQGKDRPLLVIGRADTTHVYALKLTSRERDGARDHVALGSGPWDASGRPSWVDIDQVYRLHRYGIRREAAPLPRESFERLARILARRHGWVVGEAGPASTNRG